MSMDWQLRFLPFSEQGIVSPEQKMKILVKNDQSLTEVLTKKNLYVKKNKIRTTFIDILISIDREVVFLWN